MWQAEWDAEWERLNQAALGEMKAWRAAHPKATLREIEVAVDARMAAARTRLLAAAALASEATAAERPPCPACGTPMRWEGTLPRRLTTTHEQEVELTRRGARCPACGTGLFPPG